MSYSKEMYREIILDHVANPRNKGKDENYNSITLKNPSCGDIITVYTLIEENKIIDLKYEVEGCSITVSSASIMSELLKEKTVQEAKIIIDNFFNMLTNKEFEENLLEEAISYSGIKDVPTRIKCATLPYKAFLESIGETNERL